jgi:hypothetical protein
MRLTRDQFINVEPEYVAFEAYRLFHHTGSWPMPHRLHRYLADKHHYPLEHAEHDVLVAIDSGYVYGLPTVVGRRLGEVEGDWRGPLEDEDNGFRIAMRERDCPRAARQFESAT